MCVFPAINGVKADNASVKYMYNFILLQLVEDTFSSFSSIEILSAPESLW